MTVFSKIKNLFKSRNSYLKDSKKNTTLILALASSINEASDNTFELNLYSKTGMGDGQRANNPWLQEFPDPITRTTWDNYLTISEADAKKLNLYLEPSTFFNQSKNGAEGVKWEVCRYQLKGYRIKSSSNDSARPSKGNCWLSFGYGRNKG